MSRAALRCQLYPIWSSSCLDPRPILSQALLQAGKSPQQDWCRWRQDEMPQNLTPSVDKPLVYHLLGHVDDPDSLVLSEDDYLEFLVKVMKDQQLIPDSVRTALASMTLLFAGFHLEDLGLRTLLCIRDSLPGNGKGKKSQHVAVQFEPEDGRAQRPDAVREFFRLHFGRVNTNLYWGNPEVFLQTLLDKQPQDPEQQGQAGNAP